MGGIAIIVYIVAGLVLYTVSAANYLLFHTVIELFAIVVATLIYILGSRTYRHSQNYVLLFLGIAYFYVAVFDFAHMVTFQGMNIFPGLGPGISIQFWLAGRIMEAASVLALLFPFRRHLNRYLIGGLYMGITVLTIASITVWPVFPVCYVEGAGLTPFKIGAEYLISISLLLGAWVLYRRRSEYFSSAGVAMIITAAAELSFTLYVDMYGFFNMVGHLLKAASYYHIYSSFVVHGIDTPYLRMASNLRDRALTDPLTGLYNRQGMMEVLEEERRQSLPGREGLGVLMIDLDNFKLINDRFGHLVGDEVLKEFVELLHHCIRDNDIACRFGGDEFVVLADSVDLKGIGEVRSRIMKAADAWIDADARLHGLGISVGLSMADRHDTRGLEQALALADENMYEVKRSKRARAEA